VCTPPEAVRAAYTPAELVAAAALVSAAAAGPVADAAEVFVGAADVVVPGDVVVPIVAVRTGVVTVVVVRVGRETVGTPTGNEGAVVGRSPSAAAPGVCPARRNPIGPAAASAQAGSPKRSRDAFSMSPPELVVTRSAHMQACPTPDSALSLFQGI